MDGGSGVKEQAAVDPGRFPAVRVVHALPGRLRLRLADPNEDVARLKALQQALQRSAGVRRAALNEMTGSLLLEFDPETFQPGARLLVLVRAQEPAPPAAPSPDGASHSGSHTGVDSGARAAQHTQALARSHDPLPERAPATEAARAVARWFWLTDRQVHEATGGKVDLKLLVPASLLAAGLWELLTGAAAAGVTMQTMAWYAYNIFGHFHPHEMDPDPTCRDNTEPDVSL